MHIATATGGFEDIRAQRHRHHTGIVVAEHGSQRITGHTIGIQSLYAYSIPSAAEVDPGTTGTNLIAFS